MAFPLISENVPHQEQQSEKMLIMDYIYFSAKRAHSVCTFKFMYMLHSSFQFSRENQKLYSHNANFFPTVNLHVHDVSTKLETRRQF